jgi:exodeoxyribonuclease V gamma subunit
MLAVVQSNRLEALADALVDVVRVPPAGRGPLEPETIVVQNAGMGRWLSQQLARRLGLCANVRFRFPAAFLWDAARAFLADVPEASPLEPAVATWHLTALLREVAAGDDPRFAPLRAYLAAGDERQGFELARRIADVFDQYLVYRPDWILAWENGEDDDWQAELWRRLVARAGGRHRARVQYDLTRALRSLTPPRAPLPARVALFGIPTLPPAYVALFQALAEHLDVRFFVVNPSEAYIGDVRPPRDHPRGEIVPIEGNPLVASLGRQGRELLDLVIGQGEERDAFVAPGDADLLHALQDDLLALRDRTRDDEPTGRVAPDDRSLQLHVCHSPMREVEVLHDQLLRCFEELPGLDASGIVVMAPDIERYAPCIEAVFGTAPRDRQIPFTIADRSARAESPLVEAFLAVLELPGSRYEASRLLALLDVAAVRRRLGFAADDLELVQHWVEQSAIRWATDAAMRARLGLPATPEHTWRFGLDRLLLGYAFPGDGIRLVNDVLPVDAVEGSDAEVLGRLAAFVDTLAGLDTALAAPRPPAAWADDLTTVLERLFAPAGRELAAAQAVRVALMELAASAAAAGVDEPLPLDVVRAALGETLGAAVGSGRFLTGGVTFCAMVPMRSIPFEVVCLLGLDDRSFPRARRPPSFDRVAEERRPGDRSPRDDDRWLFLEALLSARRRLILSHVGRGIRDNNEIPPSVVVSELLDYVRRGFGNPAIVTQHPLQPFSRAYFTAVRPAGLVSYSDELCRASRRRDAERTVVEPLLHASLPPIDARAISPVSLADFLRFFELPAAFLLRRRLRIRLEAATPSAVSREPFVPDNLEKFRLREALLALYPRVTEPAEALTILRAQGALPHGAAAAIVLDRAGAAVADFAKRVARARDGELPPLSIDVMAGPVRINGELRGLTPRGLVDHRLAKPRAREKLSLWIRHLLLHVARPAGIELRSLWLGLGDSFAFGPVADPTTPLVTLGELFVRGQSELVPLFPKAALALVEGGEQKARDAWEGNEYVHIPGEGDEPYHVLAWRDLDPLDAAFEALAAQVMGPLHAQLKDGAK